MADSIVRYCVPHRSGCSRLVHSEQAPHVWEGANEEPESAGERVRSERKRGSAAAATDMRGRGEVAFGQRSKSRWNGRSTVIRVWLPRAGLLLTMGEEDDALGRALELMEAVVQL